MALRGMAKTANNRSCVVVSTQEFVEIMKTAIVNKINYRYNYYLISLLSYKDSYYYKVP